MTNSELDLRVATDVLGWKPRGDRTFDACLPDGGCIATVDFLRLVYPVAVRYAPGKPGLLNDIDVCDFLPSTDANDDYAVLKFVRENWNRDKRLEFATKLFQAHHDRASEGVYVVSQNYEIGDYSRAAVACLEGKG